MASEKSFDQGVRSGPLVGLKVLDIGQLVAGPLAATLMADFGADVVKVERPGSGDPIRALAPMKSDTSLWWKVNGRNKRCISLDLKAEDGRQTFLKLVDNADVLIENFAPGTMKRMNLEYEMLLERNPRLIVLSVSGFGQTGPSRHKRGFGRVAEAFSGMAYITGYPDSPPVHSGFPIGDCFSAVLGLGSVLAAIYERDHESGRGQHIDLGLYETPFRLMEFLAIAYDQLGVVTERAGSETTYTSPVGTWRSGDGKWVSFTGSTQDMVARLFAALGRPELMQDPRFVTNDARVANRGEINKLISDWIGARTLDEVIRIFDDHDVAIAPIMSIEDIFEDEHYAARENIVEVEDDVLGVVKMPSVVPRFSRTPGSVRHAGHELDQDRDSVLDDWIGAA